MIDLALAILELIEFSLCESASLSLMIIKLYLTSINRYSAPICAARH